VFYALLSPVGERRAGDERGEYKLMEKKGMGNRGNPEINPKGPPRIK
jgi:hypothetical protein